jgi:hypothetical protein
VLAAVVIATAEMKTTEREWRPWTEKSSCA